jgi:putative FmdB family regulatory protein
MPTYQYACTNAECGHRFEQVQSFTDAALSDCPQCAERVRKVYGSVGVVFKGSGFYRNDSREAAKTSSTPASTGDSAKPAAADGSTSSTKSDSAAASPSESSTSGSSRDAAKPSSSDGKSSTSGSGKSAVAASAS